MASGQFGAVAKQMDRLFGSGTVNGLDEPALLHRFATRRDPAALEALVARHGPMVLGVCRRAIRDSHDVEDAFQATFLVMVRKAGTLRDPNLLGPWLHGVAHRVATRARQNARKRGVRERPGAEEIAMVDSSEASAVDRDDLRAVMDDEIARLPERFRRPVVLCYLEGLTHDQAALQLRCPVGTVRSRLATARTKLKERLSRRGVAVPAGAMAAAITAEAASAAVPVVLLDRTIAAAMSFAAKGMGAATAGAVSAGAASLAEGVVTTMMISKLKAIGAVMIAGAIAMGAGGAAVLQIGSGENPAKTPQKTADDAPKTASPETSATADLERKLRDNEAVLAKLRAQKERVDADIQKIDLINASYRERIDKLGGEPPSPNPPATKNETAYNARSKAGGSVRGGMGGGMGQGGMPGGMMGGMGGGMGAMMGGGGAAATGQPMSLTSVGDYVIIESADHDKLIASNPETGKSSVYNIPAGTTLMPIVGPEVVSFMIQGEAVKELVAFANGKWVTIALKELVNASKRGLNPMSAGSSIVYTIGSRVYAFSTEKGAWAVAELKDGDRPQLSVMGNRMMVVAKDQILIFDVAKGAWSEHEAGVLVNHKGHVYIYNAKGDKWTDLGLDEGSAGGGFMGGFQ